MDEGKSTKTYALTHNIDNRKWTLDDHKGLFLLTMLLRLLFRHDPNLRRAHFWNARLQIKSGSVYQCSFFRTGDNISEQFNCEDDFTSLADAMSTMHIHSVVAEHDRLHQSVKAIVQEPAEGTRKVQLLNFLKEFAFVTQCGQTTNQLRELANITPELFANSCYDRRIVPISPRYGQGAGGKNWHRNLVRYLVAAERTNFVTLVEQVYAARVFSMAEAGLIYQCCQLATQPGGRCQRVDMFNAIFSQLTGFGALACKNYWEALVAHNIIQNSTPDEATQVADGPGAKHYWLTAGVSREKILETVLAYIKDPKCKIVVKYRDTGVQTEIFFAELGLSEHNVDESLCQFWACAVGRIMEVWNNTRRGKQTPVPDYLRPNQVILDDIRQQLQTRDEARTKQCLDPYEILRLERWSLQTPFPFAVIL